MRKFSVIGGILVGLVALLAASLGTAGFAAPTAGEDRPDGRTAAAAEAHQFPDQAVPDVAPVNGDVGNDRDVENPALDQVILDDLIVDGSICVGFDCVNGESFGFDTIRLKENNVRIRFQDTSSSASFPTNDWQLTANDSSNGGANKFSIDDIDGGRTPFTVEAGARNHSLYVDDAGRIGIGTNSPAVETHLRDGDSPTVRLEQDGSSGFGAQTWDIAGNEANFFIRDVTNVSALPFRIRPGAPTSSMDVRGNGDVHLGAPTNSIPDVFIQNSTHRVGMGTTAPTETLHIRRGDGTASIRVDQVDSSTSGASVILNNEDDLEEWQFGLNANGAFFIQGDTAAGTEFLINPATGRVTVGGDLVVTGELSFDTCPACDSLAGDVRGEGFEIARLTAQNASLEARLATLEALVEQLLAG